MQEIVNINTVSLHNQVIVMYPSRLLCLNPEKFSTYLFLKYSWINSLNIP